MFDVKNDGVDLLSFDFDGDRQKNIFDQIPDEALVDDLEYYEVISFCLGNSINITDRVEQNFLNACKSQLKCADEVLDLLKQNNANQELISWYKAGKDYLIAKGFENSDAILSHVSASTGEVFSQMLAKYDVNSTCDNHEYDSLPTWNYVDFCMCEKPDKMQFLSEYANYALHGKLPEKAKALLDLNKTAKNKFMDFDGDIYMVREAYLFDSEVNQREPGEFER